MKHQLTQIYDEIADAALSLWNIYATESENAEAHCRKISEELHDYAIEKWKIGCLACDLNRTMLAASAKVIK
jgi:hypothetical protein